MVPRPPFGEAWSCGDRISRANNGGGGTLNDAVPAIEQIGLIGPYSADLVQAYNFSAIRILVEYAATRQKKKYLSKLLKPESLMAVAMTGPAARSAVTD